MTAARILLPFLLAVPARGARPALTPDAEAVKALIREGHPAQAAEAAARAAADPSAAADRPLMLTLQAQAWWSSGRFAESRAALDGLLQDPEVSAPAAAEIGSLLRRQGRRREAEDWLRGAVARHPGDRSLKVWLGRNLLDSSRCAEAAELFAAAERDGAGGRLYKFQLAQCYHAAGDFAEAGKILAAARDDSGESAMAYIRSGYFYRNAGSTTTSAEMFQKAVAVAPGDSEPLRHLGAHYGMFGDLDKAARLTEEAVALTKPGSWRRMNTQLHLSYIYCGQGLPEKAFALLVQARKERGEAAIHHGIPLQQGDILSKAGRWAEAIPFYAEAVEAAKRQGGSENRARTLDMLATAYVNTGQPDRAEETFLESLGVEQISRERRIELLQHLAHLLMDRGRRKEARPRCGELLRLVRESREPSLSARAAPCRPLYPAEEWAAATAGP